MNNTRLLFQLLLHAQHSCTRHTDGIQPSPLFISRTFPPSQTESLCLLYASSLSLPSPDSGNHSFAFCVHELDSSRNLIQRRRWHPTPVLLPGKSHGWRSLVGYSPWGHEELDTTERLHFQFSLACTGEGNGNPLQYPGLENPWDGSLVGCHLWGRTESDMTDVT